MPARLETGIEAASPAPLVDIDRHAGALADGAGVHVAVIVDVPGLLVGIVGAAAGKGGHAPMIPPI